MHLLLQGTDGLSKGAVFSIPQGQAVLIGRSRSCDICLSDLPSAQNLEEAPEVVKVKFRTVDGQHLKILFKSPQEVILEDISKNGTYVQGEKLKGSLTLTNLATEPCVLLLGLEERFLLYLSEEEVRKSE